MSLCMPVAAIAPPVAVVAPPVAARHALLGLCARITMGPFLHAFVRLF